MKPHTFTTIKWIAVVVFFTLLIWGFITDKVFIPLFGIMVGLVALSFLQMCVRGVLDDERIHNVQQKASNTAFKILMPILGLTSLALFTGGGDTEFYYIKALGIILGYSTVLGSVIHLLAYWYFNHQSGG